MTIHLFSSIEIIILTSILYLYFLAIFSILSKRQRRLKFEPLHRFGIIVPAHNEEKVIAKTLHSLKDMDYPHGLYEIIVIADDCTDNTAKIVREMGMCCMERFDNSKRGKGYALQWAFRNIKLAKYDAFVVIDADTVVMADFLKIMNNRLCNGDKVIQGYYDVLNPERSPSASLSYLGFALSRNLRYAGRTSLGWTTNLLGNGMCFSRDVIERFGWGGFSIVEDIEYEMFLLLCGIRVAFASDAKIYAEIPETFAESRIQRSRWDIGKFQILRRFFLKLLIKGVKEKDMAYFDALMELLIPPYALFLILTIFFFLMFMATNYNGIDIHFYIWAIIFLALFLYTLAGLIMARASRHVYINLIYAPLFILWRTFIVIHGFFGKGRIEWIKTERS